MSTDTRNQHHEAIDQLIQSALRVAGVGMLGGEPKPTQYVQLQKLASDASRALKSLEADAAQLPLAPVAKGE